MVEEPSKKIEVTGIVLAGGQSRRMGQDKAALPLGDRSLLAWIIRRVWAVCRQVIVVAREATAYPDCGAIVIGDRRPGCGPLGGLHSGLSATETPYAAVLACDLPFVEPALLAGLMARAPGWDVVVPHAFGRPQPLCAIYHRNVAQTAEAILRRGGGSLRQLLANPDLSVLYIPEEALRVWDPSLSSFINVNTPEEYERAKAIVPHFGAPE